MAGFTLRRRYQRWRRQGPWVPAPVHLIVSIGLLLIGLLLTASGVQTFQASIGDGTLGTYTVTGITEPSGMLHGTFVSANRQVVIKNMGYANNPRLNVGATVPAIKPSWSWLSIGDVVVFGPGRNSAAITGLAAGGVVALAAVAYLTWSIRHLIRARRTFPATDTP